MGGACLQGGVLLNYDQIEGKLRENLSERRFLHSIGVVECASDLAKRYHCDIEKTRIAAISHDCAKEMKMKDLIAIAKDQDLELDKVILAEPQLLHGPVGKYVAKRDFAIEDEEILNAIQYHTTGRANMSTLEKIIYLADIIEKNRSYNGIEEVRKLSKVDLNQAILLAIDNTVRFVLSMNALLHPQTIDARNSILLEYK